MSDVLFGKVIGRGMERICYANPNNPKTCFKVSRLGHDIQSRREIHYFDFLKKRNISADFLPKYYGYRKTKEFLIIEQELFASDESTRAMLLGDYVKQATEQAIVQLEQKLKEIKNEMIQKNIIISDIRPANMMVLEKSNGGLKRIVFLDGFGSPEFIPLPIYCPYFGRKKIERQWAKFRRHYYNEKQRG